jgi:3-deoxy-D-manno-octulosonate 8-phosphate phosphatase (KDO 8-P phosphatase)
MDVDGTLTDGSMYYGKDGETCKEFFVKDGMGIILLKKYGIKTAIMTAENTPIISQRAARLHVDFLLMGIKAKAKAIEELSRSAQIPLSQMAYIGDDINDLRAMQRVLFSCCPNDAHLLVQENCSAVMPFPGGRGAVRCLCDQILTAKGLPLNPEEPWF